MDCGGCGKANRPGARFCGGCGSPLAARCASCGAELEPDLAFCDSCGARVGGDAAAATPVVDDAVRKTVTVLFADLGGSTSFGERTDAELAREVMARYHAILQAVIDEHNGTVAKFTGDGLMAVFGIPEIAEDDAVRAVRAGVDAQRRFQAFAAGVSERHGETLTFRVGINTGEIVIGDRDADLVGDALNVAARLEKECRPGHVLVGGETWRLCRDELAFEPLGDVTVAGRAAPVAIYEVATEAAVAEPIAPFVGRQAEMERVRRALGHAMAERSAHVVTVLGSPGVGKTRLAREIAVVAAAEADAITFEIRCDRAGNATFAPVVQLIRKAADIDDETTADDARARIVELVAADIERERVADILAGVYGTAAARSVEETFWAIRRLVESLAATRPLVIVIDDIQWAEPKLLDLLEHLAEWVDRAAVLLLCLARPELRDVRPSLVETGRRVADVLALDGLDHAATAQLAAGLLGTERLPTGLIERLPGSTDGNPLFVRELVRMLVHDDVVRRRSDGEWELTIDADAVEVPPTIQSLLAARVERLPADERHVLELASVIGAEFSLGALRAVAASHVAVPSLLESMRRKELVEPTGTYWGDEPVHRFHHVLIRDAAYRRLLKATRAELHQRVGEWTDATAATLIGEHDAAIAYHYERAYEYRNELGTLAADTDRLGVRAAELLSAAAQRALGRDDLGSASSLAQRALHVLPAPETTRRAELLIVACECLLSSGDVVTGAPLIEELRTLAGSNAQLGAWAACFEAQMIGLTAPHALLDADAAATTAAETFARVGDGPGEAKAHQVRAGILARLGRIGEAKAVLDLALGAARAADDPRRVTLVLGAAPIAALFGPSPVARAGGDCLDVVRLLRITTASPSVEATSIRCQAVLEALRGRFDVSRSMLDSTRQSLEDLGLRHGLLETDLFAGMVELIADNPGAAVAPLRAAYEGLGTLGVGADAGYAGALLARALLEQGDVEEADRVATASEKLAGQNLKTAIAWRIARAEVLATRGDLHTALVHAEAAVEIAAATDLILDHADACVALGQLRERAGDTAGAQRARSDALRLYVAKGATVPAERLSGPGGSGIGTTVPVRSVVDEPVDTAVSDGSARTARVENAATRLQNHMFELLLRGAVEEVRRQLADDYVLIDRRSGVSMPMQGKPGVFDNWRVVVELGIDSISCKPVAVRGERSFVRQVSYRFEHGDTIEMLMLCEIDDRGLFTHTVYFDDSDLDAAIGDLDARYLEGEGAEHADVLRTGHAFDRAFRSDDVEAMQALMAPDFEYVDHRPLGWGQGGPDYFLEGSGSRIAAGLTEVCTINRTGHVVGRAILVVQSTVRATADGTEYEWTDASVVALDASGRINRAESYALDNFDLALARLDELGAAAPAIVPYLDNTVSRMVAPGGSGSDTSESLYADDVTIDDRRLGVSLGLLHGSDAAIETSRAMDEVFGPTEIEPVAIHGDRLALVKTRAVAESDFEVVSYMVFETNEAEEICAMVSFDETDLTAAFTELDTRYFAGEGASYMKALRVAGRYDAANARGDFDAMRSLLSPDFVVVNHQALGFGDGDRDYFVEASRTRQLVATDGGRLILSLCTAERAVLSVALGRSITDEGSEYERLDCVLIVLDDSGHIRRTEWFPPERYADAKVRFEELGAPPATPIPPYLDNPVVRLVRTSLDLMTRDDWEGLSALDTTADNVERFDRRRGVSAPPLRGAEAFGLNAFAFFDVFESVTGEPVAIRGERLALIRLHCGQPDGLQLRLLCLYECDEHGRYVFEADYDDDDLTVALAELDERYSASEGAAHRDILRVAGALREGSDRDDFDAMHDLLSPGFHFIDRQPLGFGQGDGDTFIHAIRTRTQVATDGEAMILSVLAAPDALLTTVVTTTITDEGSQYERAMCTLLAFDESRHITHLEWFDLDAFAEAAARYHELEGALDGPAIENAASRVAQRYSAAWAPDRLDDLREFVARQMVRIDHRSIMAAPETNDYAGFVESTRRFAEAGYTAMSFEPLAVRGERLCLGLITHRNDAAFTTQYLVTGEVDEDSRMVRVETFDESALDTALAGLEEQYIAGEGSEDEYLIRRIGDMVRAERRGDSTAWEAVFSPDVALELAPDPTCLPRALTIRNDAALLCVERSGLRTYQVMRSVVGLFVEVEVFAIDDRVHAEARFEEFAAEKRTPQLDDDQVRALARMDWLIRFEPGFDGGERYHPDCVLVDKRRGVNAGEIVGGGDVAASINSGVDVFGALALEVMATRGEHLALVRWRFEQEGGFNQPGLCVSETDGYGQTIAMVSFDEDDLASAMVELETRFRAASGEAYDAADAFIAACETRTVACAPGSTVRVGQLCVKSYAAGDVVLAVWADGSYSVAPLDDKGDATSCELFDADQWTDALARFDELS